MFLFFVFIVYNFTQKYKKIFLPLIEIGNIGENSMRSREEVFLSRNIDTLRVL